MLVLSGVDVGVGSRYGGCGLLVSLGYSASVDFVGLPWVLACPFLRRWEVGVGGGSRGLVLGSLSLFLGCVACGVIVFG